MNAPLRHPLTTTRPPRIDSLARLPVFFALAGKRAVVAGGNTAAAWKAELMGYTNDRGVVPTIVWSDGRRQVGFPPGRG